MPIVTQPCQDTNAMADACHRALDIDRLYAAELGHQAVKAAHAGHYILDDGRKVDWSAQVERAISSKVSIPPEASLPIRDAPRFPLTRVTVANDTTLNAARVLASSGTRPLVLNMANGAIAGGGFLSGSIAQEESLCRSSALHATLDGDPMYQSHRDRQDYESSDWMILSPDVPVFRTDVGLVLSDPWICSFMSCAAPVQTRVGQPRSSVLMADRIDRLLSAACSYGFDTLVLGAWGCGAFGNDPVQTAATFRFLLANRHDAEFRDVVFAISDWSPERRFLGPFRSEFAT
ncbi:MAG: TIGR02452 family protein [Actinobacteria bacterium]|nr:TIGR02452 family protein [Actinomycetota bacterium]